MESVVARGRPRSAEADERIIAAALHALREQGYGELSIEQVAADASVSKATVYRRYRNKADLTSAALASISGPALARPLPDATRAALAEFLRRIDSVMERVGFGVIAAMFQERDPELLELHRQRTIAAGRQRAHGILARAVARGEIRADADFGTATEMLVGSLFARRLTGSRAPGWPESAVDALLRGLAR